MTLRTSKTIVRFCAALTALVSLAQLFPGEIHLFQLLEAFQLPTLIGSLFLLVLSLILKRKIPAFIFLMSALAHAYECYPYYWPNGIAEERSGHEFAVVHANLWHHNPQHREVSKALLNLNADVILVQELSYDWADHLNQELIEFEYRVLISHPKCCYGIGLYSRLPILKCDTLDLENTPVLVATIDGPTHPIDLVYIHTRPPAFPDETAERDRQLESAATIISELENPWILAGDLNVVPWAESFKYLLLESDAVDSRLGAKLTFPAKPFPLIPIDHLIHDRRLQDHGMQTFGIPGSDHLGIRVQFDQ